MRHLPARGSDRAYSDGSMARNTSRYRLLLLLASLVSIAVLCLRTAWGGSFDFTPLQWSPDGRHLVRITGTGPADPLQCLAEFVSRKPKVRERHYEIWLLRSDGSPLRRVSRQPDFPQWAGDKHLLLGRETLPAQGDLRWDLLDLRGRRVARIVPEAPKLLAWEVSPDGRYLAYVGHWPQNGFECAVFLYQFSERRTVGRHDLGNFAWNISWSPDSRYLYIAGAWRLDVALGRLEHKNKERLSIAGFNDFAANDAGQMVAAVARVGLTSVDWETGEAGLIARGNFGAIAFGRDPEVFICGKWKGDAQTVEVWLGRLRDGAWQLSQLKGVRAPGAAIALSRDSKRFAYEAPDGSVKIREIPR